MENNTFAGKIALTFDDGPHEVTDSVLDCFKKHGGVATFFVMGNRIAQPENHARAVRALDEGHDVASHSYDHVHLSELTRDEIIEQIKKTDTILNDITGNKLPPFMRTPYFAYSKEMASTIAEFDYALIHASVDPNDWDDAMDTDGIVKNVMSQARDGSIVLLHDVHERTREAVERIVPELISKGFKLVTVSELLSERVGVIEPGVVYEHGHK